ncbi:hypothetical protein GQ53DRAFT_819468 [Thozetella sp. PMI_491]|nr:hypothetical protein GQ53DRAFT_819468 [Thozetella sp. PMI_491]
MAQHIAFGFAVLVVLAALGTNFFTSIGSVWEQYHDREYHPKSLNNDTIELASPNARIFSYDPLIIHITNLISPSEREYLKQLALPRLQKSTVVLDGEKIERSRRTSSTAFLPREDAVIQRIAKRAIEFQGYMEHRRVDIQVTSYQEGQEYRPHFDWIPEGEVDFNRFSTIFAILEASCDDCGTQFPEIDVDWTKRDKEWCEYLDCSQNVLTTKNINGSALFWRNLDDDLRGRLDTMHSGLPAKGGFKIGLNIWTEVDVSRPADSRSTV